MHVLPDLAALEEKFTPEDGVVVLGVHSAKFHNEKVSSNILSAILRYGIHHPVVNDAEAMLWHALSIQCWPTFAVVGPLGQLLCVFAGEGHRENLTYFIDEALKYFSQKGEISRHEIGISPQKHEFGEKNSLRFPGKIAVSRDGRHLAVSDTGHHRLLILDQSGIVQVLNILVLAPL